MDTRKNKKNTCSCLQGPSLLPRLLDLPGEEPSDVLAAVVAAVDGAQDRARERSGTQFAHSYCFYPRKGWA